MSVLTIHTDTVGTIGTEPRIIRIDTNNTQFEVLATGYLNSVVAQGVALSEKDIAAVTTKTTPSATEVKVGWYEVHKSGADWSLTSTDAPGNVILPTTVNHMAIFNDAIGTLRDGSSIAINNGDIQAGNPGIASGSLIATPLTPTSGFLRIIAGVNPADVATNISNAPHAQATLHLIPDPGVADATLLTAAITSGDPASLLIQTTVTVTQADLATGGTVILIPVSGTHSYRIIDMKMDLGGTNFSGGGGDRLLEISDSGGGALYSVVAAADLAALTNNRWGDAKLPAPASVGWGTAVPAGEALIAQYNGGTTDYTAGSVDITVLVQEIT